MRANKSAFYLIQTRGRAKMQPVVQLAGRRPFAVSGARRLHKGRPSGAANPPA